MEVSQASIAEVHGQNNKNRRNRGRDKSDHRSAIFGMITDQCKMGRNDQTVMRDALEKKILARGYTVEDLEDCLREYE